MTTNEEILKSIKGIELDNDGFIRYEGTIDNILKEAINKSFLAGKEETQKEQVYQGVEYQFLIKEMDGISTGRISQFVDIFENEYHLIYSKYPSGRGRKRIIFLDKFFFDNAVKCGIINLEEFLPSQ